MFKIKIRLWLFYNLLYVIPGITKVKLIENVFVCVFVVFVFVFRDDSLFRGGAMLLHTSIDCWNIPDSVAMVMTASNFREPLNFRWFDKFAWNRTVCSMCRLAAVECAKFSLFSVIRSNRRRPSMSTVSSMVVVFLRRWLEMQANLPIRFRWVATAAVSAVAGQFCSFADEAFGVDLSHSRAQPVSVEFVFSAAIDDAASIAVAAVAFATAIVVRRSYSNRE